jgi:hypothetical protein
MRSLSEETCPVVSATLPETTAAGGRPRLASQSSMRESIQLRGKATTKKAKIMRIRKARRVFKWLPVKYSNDLVHGSWWMVWAYVN